MWFSLDGHYDGWMELDGIRFWRGWWWSRTFHLPMIFLIDSLRSYPFSYYSKTFPGY